MGTTARENVDVPSRVAAEHERLFEDIARRFYTGVYNYLRWMSRDDVLAEDLTQETFMQVWRHLGDMRDRNAARMWIYRIARNEFLQHRRRPHLDTVPMDLHNVSDAPPTPICPQDALERQALQAAVGDALARLGDAHREVIVLHNLEGLSLRQISHVLDVPIGTVKSRRAKAFHALRDLLGKEVRSDDL
jgi:RNA polymerase sigma-70 factor (ECF subfamily)